jgi:hypothetical protein
VTTHFGTGEFKTLNVAGITCNSVRTWPRRSNYPAPPAIKRREPFIDGVTRACLDEKIEDGFAQVICALF